MNIRRLGPLMDLSDSFSCLAGYPSRGMEGFCRVRMMRVSSFRVSFAISAPGLRGYLPDNSRDA